VETGAGLAGIIGGVVLAAALILPGLQSTAAANIGLSLVGICEIGLLLLMARSHPRWGLAVAVVLGLSALVRLIGWWTYSSIVLGAFALIAFGVGTWFFAAPAIALVCAKTGQLGWAPGLILSASTVGLVVAGSPYSSRLPSIVAPLYCVAWAWVGFALLARARKAGSGD